VSGPVIAFCTEFDSRSKREVERGHLADLTLAAQAHPDQHQEVDHSRAQHDLQQHLASGEKHSSHYS